MSNHAYIYEAVRTPRSKGKKDGSLHEVKPIDLGAGLLREIQQRHDLDTSYVDDVVMQRAHNQDYILCMSGVLEKS